ncbi:MAG: holo-ACP synthase [Candidatus Izimaplasma sp.]|nr:holo-ACP synthase [Candidatus Izimaplasma bacterium]
MIKGIGIDICKIDRLKLTSFKRILSEEEIEVYKSFKLLSRKKEYLAGRFALKEAIVKAFGNLDLKVYLKDITILNDSTGKPYVKEPNYNDYFIWVSISHEKENVIAQAIIEENK